MSRTRIGLLVVPILEDVPFVGRHSSVCTDFVLISHGVDNDVSLEVESSLGRVCVLHSRDPSFAGFPEFRPAEATVLPFLRHLNWKVGGRKLLSSLDLTAVTSSKKATLCVQRYEHRRLPTLSDSSFPELYHCCVFFNMIPLEHPDPLQKAMLSTICPSRHSGCDRFV
jgi:hypothetical protein